MYTDEQVQHHVLMKIDITIMKDDDDFLGDGWALIHLTPDGSSIKGLHYLEDKEFDYTDYIAEYYIGEHDMIMCGKVQEGIFHVIDLLK